MPDAATQSDLPPASAYLVRAHFDFVNSYPHIDIAQELLADARARYALQLRELSDPAKELSPSAASGGMPGANDRGKDHDQYGSTSDDADVAANSMSPHALATTPVPDAPADSSVSNPDTRILASPESSGPAATLPMQSSDKEGNLRRDRTTAEMPETESDPAPSCGPTAALAGEVDGPGSVKPSAPNSESAGAGSPAGGRSSPDKPTISNGVSAPPEAPAFDLDTVLPPALVPGENIRAYKALRHQISLAVRPTDLIEELWVRDVVYHTWDLQRGRKAKASVLNAAAPLALKSILTAVNWGNAGEEAEEMWSSGDTAKRASVMGFLAERGSDWDDVLAQAHTLRDFFLERIAKRVAAAEAARNAVLREVDRRRDFARRLRGALAEIKDAEFEVVTDVAPEADV